MSSRASPAPTKRTRVRRIHERGRYGREAIDAGARRRLVAHLGFVHDGQPFVIPTLYARVGDEDGDPADAGLDVWAGHIPLVTAALDPVPDPDLRPGITVPTYALRYRRPGPTA